MFYAFNYYFALELNAICNRYDSHLVYGFIEHNIFAFIISPLLASLPFFFLYLGNILSSLRRKIDSEVISFHVLLFPTAFRRTPRSAFI